MSPSADQFIEAIERRKRPFDEVLEAYRVLREADRIFHEKLALLPPDLVSEVELMLGLTQPRDVPVETGKTDLAGKTAVQFATTILSERNNEPLHFSIIAKEALLRGYQGRRSGSSAEVENRTTNSFWAAMSRARELEGVGKGLYRIRSMSQRAINWEETKEIEASSSRDELPGASGAIRELLERHPNGLRNAEIAEQLEGKIATTSKDPRRLILSSLEQMKRKGRLTQDVTGKFYLPSQKPEASDSGKDQAEEDE